MCLSPSVPQLTLYRFDFSQQRSLFLHSTHSDRQLISRLQKINAMLSQNHEEKKQTPTSRTSDYTPSVFLYVLAFATAFWCEPRKIYVFLLYDIQRKRQVLMVLELGKVASQHTYYKLKILLRIKHIYHTYLREDPGLSQSMGFVWLIPFMTTRQTGVMIHHYCQAGGEIILLFITAPVKDQNSQSSFYWIYIVFTPWWCWILIN